MADKQYKTPPGNHIPIKHYTHMITLSHPFKGTLHVINASPLFLLYGTWHANSSSAIVTSSMVLPPSQDTQLMSPCKDGH